MTSPGEMLVHSVPNSEVEFPITVGRQNILKQSFQHIGRLAARTALSLSLAVTGGAVAGTTAEMGEHRPPAAAADTGGYPDWNKPCVANNNNVTQGSGYWCPDYQWGDYIYNDRGQIVGNRQNSSRGYGYRNCTDWAAWRVDNAGVGTVPGGWGNAKNWDDAAIAAGKTVDTAPEPGDIAVWNNGNYGHVAFVEEIGTGANAGKVRVSEYNQQQDGNYRNDRWVAADKYIDLNGTGKGLNNEPWPPAGSGSPTHPLTRNTVNFTSPDKFEDIAWYEQYPGTDIKPTLGALVAHGAGFTPAWKAPAIGPADWKATGDFDGDGKTDIAWHEGTDLNIFKSTGQSYHKEISMPNIGPPTWAGVGDFNNDGKDDIAWYEQNTGTLKAFIANSNGTWLDVRFYAAGIGPADWAAVGDFNGDDYDDVAWHEGGTLSTIASHEGRSWTEPLRSPNIGPPTWAQVGEFTGDKQDDIAWYEAGSSTLTVLPGDRGFFPIGESRRTRNIGPPKWAQVGDFDGDKKDDVAWLEQYPGYPNSLSAFISDGNRLNKKWAWVGIGRPTWAGVGEFTGDNNEDLAWHEGSTLTIIRSDGGAWTVNDSHRTPNIGRPVWASRGAFPLQ